MNKRDRKQYRKKIVAETQKALHEERRKIDTFLRIQNSVHLNFRAAKFNLTFMAEFL